MHAPIASTRFPLRKWHMFLGAAMVALFLSCLLILGPRLIGTDDRAPRTVKVHSQLLNAEVEMLRTWAYQGPTIIRACLYGRDPGRCTDDRWLPYERIDTVSAAIKRVRQPGELDILGCVYVERNNICTCEPHNFSLTLAESR